jgi:hypothetical protein
VHDTSVIDTTVAAATAQLLAEVADGTHPFAATASALGSIAAALHVDRVVVAVDDPGLGRQLFASDRKPLHDTVAGLWGPPRVLSEPAVEFGPTATALLVGAVGLALRPMVTEAGLVPAVSEPTVIERHAESRARFEQLVVAAAARARRHGWGVTLARLHLETPVDDVEQQLASTFREGDTVGVLGEHEIGILFAATPSADVPLVLQRAAQRCGLPTLSFGVATCPGDETEADALMALAEARLAEARRARG